MPDEDTASEMDLEESIAYLESEAVDEDGDGLDILLYPRKDLFIGRDYTCNYTISDSRVSKKHLRVYSIIYENKKRPSFPPLVYCEDLESFNGTFINDKLIGKIAGENISHLLCDGDLIEIRPHWRFRFHQSHRQVVVRPKAQLEDLNFFNDSYHITNRMLGNGRYGSVYLASHRMTAQQIACKIVDIDLAAQSLAESQIVSGNRKNLNRNSMMEIKKKILREIRILTKLDHPNIINLRKAYCSQTALYIFTELAPGGDLFSYMQANGGYLDDHHCRFITRQVALALRYLHSENIAHRDIKPENILVTHTHFGGRVVLTDFGFAKHFVEGRMTSKLGTNGYAAPEVETVDLSDQGYTEAADLWSLGVLTACLLTGDTVIPRKILSSLSPFQITARHQSVDERYAEEQWKRICPRALKFVRALIVVKPEGRLTAEQALEHTWYMKPLKEAEALKEAIDRVTRLWKPRENDGDLLESLPGTILAQSVISSPVRKRYRHKLPDASSSPYFGLDRYTHQRVISSKEKLLEKLALSGSHFLTPVKILEAHADDKIRQYDDFLSVGDSDLFGLATGQVAKGSESIDAENRVQNCTTVKGNASKILLPTSRVAQQGIQKKCSRSYWENS